MTTICQSRRLTTSCATGGSIPRTCDLLPGSLLGRSWQSRFLDRLCSALWRSADVWMWWSVGCLMLERPRMTSLPSLKA